MPGEKRDGGGKGNAVANLCVQMLILPHLAGGRLSAGLTVNMVALSR